MSLLTPLFLLGLAGLAVPIVIHLIQRERKNVVQFPSLMFLQRIPYQSVRRRRIRNWPLLLLRLAALALIVLAFARPFFRRQTPAGADAGGAREVVILIDRSYSMGYGDRWARAVAGARDAIGKLSPGDRASIVFFASGAEVVLRSTSDRGRLDAAIAAGKPGASATRYGPALKLAGSILSESTLPRREVILVSDFQRSGWTGAEGVRLPDGATLTPVAITDADPVNLSVTPVSLQRTTFSEQDRVTVTGGVVNHGARPLKHVELSLEVDGRLVQKEPVDLEPGGSASVTFAPFTPSARNTRGTVRLGADALQADNAFNFLVSPKQPLRIIIAERPGAPRDASLYLSRALALGEAPPFDVSIKSIDAVTQDDLQRAAIVVLNDTPVSPLTAGRLKTFVERGGGLLLIAGERASLAVERHGVPAGPAWRARRSDAGAARATRRARVRQSDLRAVPRATQRGFLGRAVLRVSLGHAGARRADRGAVRRRRPGARREADRHRTRAGVDLHARRRVERPGAQAGVPAVRAPHGDAAGVLHRAPRVGDGR